MCPLNNFVPRERGDEPARVAEDRPVDPRGRLEVRAEELESFALANKRLLKAQDISVAGGCRGTIPGPVRLIASPV